MPMQVQELKRKCEMEKLIKKVNLPTILVLLWKNLISQQSIEHSKIDLAGKMFYRNFRTPLQAQHHYC